MRFIFATLLAVIAVSTVSSAVVNKVDPETIVREIIKSTNAAHKDLKPIDDKIDVTCKQEASHFACTGSSWMIYKDSRVRMSIPVELIFGKDHVLADIKVGNAVFDNKEDQKKTEVVEEKSGFYGLWDKIKKGAKNLGNKVADGVKHLGGEVKKEGDKVGKAVGDGAKHLGEEVKKEGDKIGKGIHHLGDEIKKLANNETVKEVIQIAKPYVEQALKDAVKAKVAAIVGKVALTVIMAG